MSGANEKLSILKVRAFLTLGQRIPRVYVPQGYRGYEKHKIVQVKGA
jgi:hypothetical protein